MKFFQRQEVFGKEKRRFDSSGFIQDVDTLVFYVIGGLCSLTVLSIKTILSTNNIWKFPAECIYV